MPRSARAWVAALESWMALGIAGSASAGLSGLAAAESSSERENAAPGFAEIARRSCAKGGRVLGGCSQRHLLVWFVFAFVFVGLGDRFARAFERDGEYAVRSLANIGQQRFDIFGGGGFAIVGLAEFGALAEKFPRQGVELQLGEERASGFGIGRLGFHLCGLEVHGHVGVDGDQLFAEQHHAAVVLEGLAIGLALDFGGVIERVLDAAEALNEIDGAFVADAGSAGDVVDGVAAQGHHVNDALGRNAENFLHLGGVADEVVFGRVEHPDAIVDELHHVLVVGDDEDGVAIGGGPAGEGADDVVSLVALGFDDGNAEGFEGAADVGNLLQKIRGRLGAIGLVASVFDVDVGLGPGVELAVAGHGRGLLVAKGGAGEIERRSDVLRVEVGAKLAQHVDEDEGRSRGNAGLVGHGALVSHGVIGAEDERHGVDEEDAALGAFRLRGKSRGGFGLGSGGGRGGFFLRRQGGILPEVQRQIPAQAST